MNHSDQVTCLDCQSRSLCLLKSIPDSSLYKIENAKSKTRYSRGSTVFNQDSLVTGLHIIASGKLKLSAVTKEGKETITQICSSGDMFGHKQLYNSRKYSSTATVIEDAQVCFFEKESIRRFIENDPEMSKELLIRMTRELEFFEARDQFVLAKCAKARVAELLLNLSSGTTPDASGKVALNLQLTRSEMASMIGVASETLIRLLSQLKQEKLVEQTGRILTIINVDRLRELT